MKNRNSLQKINCQMFFVTARVLSMMAFMILGATSLLAQQRTTIDSLETLLKNTKEDISRVIILNDLSKELNLLWENEKAMSYAQKALSFAEKFGYKRGVGIARKNMASIWIDRRMFGEARVDLQSGIEISQETGDNNTLAECYLLLGRLNAKQNDYQEAMKHYDLCLNISKETNDHNTIASCYLEMSNVHYSLDDYPQAYNTALLALKLYEETGYLYGIVAGNITVGVVHDILQEYEASKKNYDVCLEILEGTGNRRQYAELFFHVAVYYWNVYNYDSSMNYFVKAKNINEELGDEFELGRCYGAIAKIFLEWNRYTEALENSKKAAAILVEKTGTKRDMIYLYIDIGDIFFRQGKGGIEPESGKKLMEAEAYYNKSIKVAREIGDRHGTWKGHMRLYHLDSLIGRYDLALNHYITARTISDSVFNEFNSKELGKLMVQYETEKKDKEIAILSRDNSLKALQVEHQKTALLASDLELENKQLQLARTKKDLDNQRLETKVQAAGMALMTKEKELKEQQLEKQKLLRNGLFIGIAFLFLVGFLLFRSWQLRKKLEKQSAIMQERKRISADLHDDIGSGLSKISLLSEMVKQEARSTGAKAEAEKIASTARELLDSIREIIWTLNTNNDYLENLVSYIRRYAAEYFENTKVKLTIDTPEEIPQTPISGENRRNIFYSVKEAMHNIVKHADASEAELKFSFNNGLFSVSIKDNGKGFPEGELNRFGNGIKNMISRMETIKGNVLIENHAGTKITLALPV